MVAYGFRAIPLDPELDLASQMRQAVGNHFTISFEGLPDNVDSIAFPTIQSYDNGQDVSWIDPVIQGQPEPDHPTPVLQLTAAEGSVSKATDTSAPSTTPAVSATVVKKETNNTLGIIAIILGAAGLIIGLVALARGRGSKAPQPEQPVS